MQKQWLSHKGTSSLILVFGGWALGANIFTGMVSHADVLLLHDYRNLDDPLPELKQYDHVYLVAFSIGVVSAAHWIRDMGFQPDRLTAISGTLSPDNAEKGINPEIIRATANNLSNNSFVKFCRRAGLTHTMPTIDINAASAELNAIINRGPAPDHPFDRIWIPQHDRIIPTQSQEMAWEGQKHSILRCFGSHIPFISGQNWEEWIK